MKLGFSLLAFAVQADEPVSEIEPYLTQLGDYCKATYGLPAYRRHREDTRQDWKLRWTNKKRIQTIRILFLHYKTDFKLPDHIKWHYIPPNYN